MRSIAVTLIHTVSLLARKVSVSARPYHRHRAAVPLPMAVQSAIIRLRILETDYAAASLQVKLIRPG